MKRFPWILTVVTVAALAALVSLGTWQLRRLSWKEGLIAQAEAARDQPPVDLAEVGDLPDPEFRRVVAGCDMRNRPYVELQTIHEGEPGVRLISACRGWLVDMGFVSEKISARPPATNVPPAGPGLIPYWTAQVRAVDAPSPFAPPPSNGRFFARDAAAMGEALGLSEPPPPWVLYAETSPLPEWLALQAAPPPPAFSNNHLGYALTWFGLAIALVGFYVALLRRRLRKPAP
ncbi:SURF1 family protein [Brevundimonas sp.]|jgi:surfeit locus 1 family protein|uniref:SURF1 family protein n=1 Tax=Brevundimonas sp. TaxID=1871086 RepID=UPI002E12DB7E|nr:SURF1 family cytochrome oxidase biogenesis protein [Brevundimonas sp.]